ncbi:MAG: ABC transporter substrate-binding protein [Deltaproteobacteria bacterium]|nr:ABC transporter substrate-binding protein [Deltaproteobacteria bacterium]MBI3077054.1 ABC transporter substrate-binding protein [Deltaproteobacteria bacterium]
MTKTWLALLTVVTVVAGVAPVHAQPPGPVKVAFLGSLSGPFTIWGVQVRDGMKLAIKELNEKGGVLGRKLELVERDDKNSPSEGVTAFRYLVEREGVIAAGGMISSDVGLAVSREAEAARVPFFMTMSGSHAILKRSSRFTFRTCLVAAPMNMQPAAALIKERKYTRVAAIIADYGWGHAFREAFETLIKPLPGVRTQLEVAPVPERDFTPYLRKLQGLDPELIIAMGHPPGNTTITRQAVELGMKALVIGSWIPAEMTMQRVGELAFGRFIDYTCADYESPGYQRLAEQFYATYKRFFEHNAFSGYVTVKMVADAVQRTRSLDPKAIAEAIRNGKFVQEGYGWPISYTEWGEMKEATPIIYTYEKGTPRGNINPGATWRLRVIFRSPPLRPYVPAE